MAFKDRLKKLRGDKGITQEELAKALDVPASTIRRLESAVSGYPKKERLETIADYFGCSVDYLLERTIDTKVASTDTEKKHPAQILREYMDMGLTNEEIKKRMDFMVDVFTLNDKEVDEFISFLRWRLAEKKQPTGSASKAEEQ